MDARRSAYEALGLRPGADRAQIDDAYRRLIKVYHPDRMGGDGGRAAEINRAYFELRNLPPEPPPIRVASGAAPVVVRRPRARFGRVLLGSLAAAAIVLVSARGDLARTSRTIVAGIPLVGNDGRYGGGRNDLVSPLDNFDEPLSGSAIDRSAADALRLFRAGDPAMLATYSQACQSQFRNHPSITWFDSCAAYDEAVVLLQSRDPLADSGPFNPAAVTAREMGAARQLSDDSLAADLRLHQIRSRIEFVLIPKVDPPTVDQGPPADPSVAAGRPSGASAPAG